jgi:hypothetical protein
MLIFVRENMIPWSVDAMDIATQEKLWIEWSGSAYQARRMAPVEKIKKYYATVQITLVFFFLQ